jgi:pimeloyl-ACP methyl ester carboxylesterase
MLCTHGTGFHAWMWWRGADELARSHHVWSLDLRGHGSSDPSPDRTYLDWWAYASDVLAAVDGLGLERPVGVGHSLGGASLLLAELARPGTFSALWCYEPIIPPPGARHEEGTPDLAEMARRRRNRFDSLDAAAANYRSKPPFAGFAPGALEDYVDHAFVDDGEGVSLVLPGPEEATCYEGAGTSGAWDRLGELQLPVTVAGGGETAGAAAWVPAIAARIAGARVERFDDLGHFGPMEDPGRVGRAAAAALRGEGTA